MEERKPKQKNIKGIIIIVIDIILLVAIGYLVFDLYIKKDDKLPVKEVEKPVIDSNKQEDDKLPTELDENIDDDLNNEEVENSSIGKEVENDLLPQNDDYDYNTKDITYLLRQFECNDDKSCEIKLDKNNTVKITYAKDKKTRNTIYINNKLVTEIPNLYEKIDPAYFSIVNENYILFFDNNTAGGDASGNFYIFDSNGKLVVNFAEIGIKNALWKNIEVIDGKYQVTSSDLMADMGWSRCFPNNSKVSLSKLDKTIVRSKDIYELKDGQLILVENVYKKTLNDDIKEKYNMTCAQLRDLGEDGAQKKISDMQDDE